jgi:20S proteasome subunit beta 2
LILREQGMQLVARAIRSGIFNDLGSGSNVDLCIITKGKARNFGLSPGLPYGPHGQYDMLHG